MSFLWFANIISLFLHLIFQPQTIRGSNNNRQSTIGAPLIRALENQIEFGAQLTRKSN